MKIALLAYGSRGDTQPMVVLADALKRRGHEVRLTVNVDQARWASSAGVDIIPMRPDVGAFVGSPGGRDMLENGRIIAFMREVVKLEQEHNPDLIRACGEACQGADLIVSTMLTVFRATSLAEAVDAPHVCAVTAPVFPTGQFASHVVPFIDLGAKWLNRLSWDLYFALYWMGQKKVFNAARVAAGRPEWKARPPVELGHFIHMYSSQLVALPDDVPESHVQAGHARLSPELRARLGEGSLPPGLETWLDAGPPPVFFGFGSVPALDPAALLRTVSELCRKHSIRALIGSGWSVYEPRDLPDSVFIAPSFDHDRVLPRCQAAVHHGGAGTTHTSLSVGLPTLVCSVFGDQPFWGHRVTELGAGATFPLRKLNEARLSTALEQLLRPETRERAEALGRALRAENGTELIADRVESFATSQGQSLPRQPPLCPPHAISA